MLTARAMGRNQACFQADPGNRQEKFDGCPNRTNSLVILIAGRAAGPASDTEAPHAIHAHGLCAGRGLFQTDINWRLRCNRRTFIAAVRVTRTGRMWCSSMMRCLRFTSSPVVALNRALASAELHGAGAGLDAMPDPKADARLFEYQPYWAARAELLVANDEACHA